MHNAPSGSEIRRSNSKNGRTITRPGHRTACPSAAASAPYEPSKKPRSRARSGRLHGRVRRSGRHHSGCEWHPPTTPAYSHTGTTGVWSPSRTPGITRGTTGRALEPHPAQNYARHNGPRSGITPSTRSDCPPRAFSTTGLRTTPAQRAISRTSLRTTPAQRALSTTGRRTTPAQRTNARRSQHNGRLGSTIRHINSKKGLLTTFPGRRTDCRSAAASAPQKHSSKTERSCARSGRLQRRVRRSGRIPSSCQPHGPTTPAQDRAGTTGVHLYHTQHTLTPCTTSLERNHAQHTATLPRTGYPHNRLSYHAA